VDANLLVAGLLLAGTSGGLVGGFVGGHLLGRARGLADGLARGIAEGRALGHAEGHAAGLEEGRRSMLQRLEVKTEHVTRKSTVFPWRRATDTVRHELWIDGVPTSLRSEHVITDEVEVDEKAMRTLLEVGANALTGGASGVALGLAEVATDALQDAARR
jgi:hypothetical protein